MKLLMLGVNHRTARLEVRERVAFSGPRLDEALRRFRAAFPKAELVILSTCNRTELYVARPVHAEPDAGNVLAFLASEAGVGAGDLAPVVVAREDREAAAHLFRVAAGLDSMVLGEPQILGQVRRAYEAAKAQQAVTDILHRLFQQAISTARAARRTAGLDAGGVSIGSVAADFAREIFYKFDDKIILALGAGDMAKVALKRLAQLRPRELWVANRTATRAEALATALAARLADVAPPQVKPWEEMDALLAQADIVVSSTASPEPILTANRVAPLMRRRRGKPLFLIDLALPRDVEAAVGKLPSVYLYNLDDLQRVVEKSCAARSQQLDQAEAALLHAALACVHDIQHRDVGRVIAALRQRLHSLGTAEQERTVRKLAALPPEELAEALPRLLEEHDHRLINKILHLPMSQLDPHNPQSPVGFYAAALRRLFNIDVGDMPAGEIGEGQDPEFGDQSPESGVQSAAAESPSGDSPDSGGQGPEESE